MRLLATSVLTVLLAACAPDPTGDWVGVTPVVAEDGTEYRNELHVQEETASGTFYFVADNTQTPDNLPTIFSLVYSATWVQDGDAATFDLDCGTGCAFAMDCDIGDQLVCDLTPDLFLDEAANLTFDPE